MTVNKIGDEFLVNTTTLSTQRTPSVAGLSDGGFVAVWEDGSRTGEDTSRDGFRGGAVRGQTYNADGTSRGDEFLVNTTTEDRQRIPSVTELSDGGFVVVWEDQSQTGKDTFSEAIRAQAYNADGTMRGDEFLVNTITESRQDAPSVAGLSDGGFVAVWNDDSRAGGFTGFGAIRGQAFNSDGTARGFEFLVNTTTEGTVNYPSVADLSDGGFVVTWEDFSKTGADTSGGAVRGQAYNADGTMRGEEFLVNTTTVDDQRDPSVAGLSNGGFVVTWMDFSETGDDTSSGIGFRATGAIRGQAYNADGTARGDEFLVNTTTENAQRVPSVTSLSDGGFVATWEDFSETGNDRFLGAIRAQAYNADGTTRGEEFLVNTTTVDAQRDPSVAGLSDDRLVVTWEDFSRVGEDASGSAVRGQIFSLDGGANAAPLASSDSASTPAGEIVTIDVLANDSDADGDALRIQSSGNPANGTVSVTSADELRYTPDTGFSGTDGFTYTVSDGEGGTDTATVEVTVEPANQVPVASDDSATTTAGDTVTIDVLANDSDADGDALSIQSLCCSGDKSVSVTRTDQIRYMPDDGFKGTDSFTYTVSDGEGGTDTATVTVEVIEESASEPPAIGENDDFKFVQRTSPDVLGAGAGDDTYILSSGTLNGSEEITISDGLGTNRVQLVSGLEIAESEVAANALKLVLGNGSEITVLGADEFRYEAGANVVAGETATNVDFDTFVSETLGVEVPTGGIISGGSGNR